MDAHIYRTEPAGSFEAQHAEGPQSMDRKPAALGLQGSVGTGLRSSGTCGSDSCGKVEAARGDTAAGHRALSRATWKQRGGCPPTPGGGWGPRAGAALQAVLHGRLLARPSWHICAPGATLRPACRPATVNKSVGDTYCEPGFKVTGVKLG